MCGETLLAGIIKMRAGFKVGDTVTYRTRANRKRIGVIDKVSDESGVRLFRVDDHWFLPEGLEATG